MTNRIIKACTVNGGFARTPYLADNRMNLKPGDLIVVPGSNRFGFELAKVMEVESSSAESFKHPLIVGKVDFAQWRKLTQPPEVEDFQETKRVPLLCRIGLHKWVEIGKHDSNVRMQCKRCKTEETVVEGSISHYLKGTDNG